MTDEEMKIELLRLAVQLYARKEVANSSVVINAADNMAKYIKNGTVPR